MPGMPGSFGRLSGPLAMATKRAVIRSPRSVLMIQRSAGLVPAQLGDAGLEQGVVVEAEVAGDRAWQCSRISGAKEYLCFGM